MTIVNCNFLSFQYFDNFSLRNPFLYFDFDVVTRGREVQNPRKRPDVIYGRPQWLDD